MGAFQDFIIRLDDMGVTDVLLPFLLIFTIFFAILQKTKVLGEAKKNMNVAVAAVIALIVVIPHVTGAYPTDLDPIVIINRALPAVSVVVVALIMLMILIGIFGGEYKMFGVALSGWIVFLSIIIIAWIFGAAADWWSGWQWIEVNLGEDVVSMLVILIVFGLIVAWVTAEPKDKHAGHETGKFREDLRNIFGGGGSGGH